MTFSEAMAAQVIELQRELANTRREVLRLRRSRELWKLRYKWAALAARNAAAAREPVVFFDGPKQMPPNTSAYNWKRPKAAV